MLTENAVLTDGGIWLGNGKRRAWPYTIRHVSDLARHAIADGVRALWVHPDSLVAVRAKEQAFWAKREGWRSFPTGPKGQCPITTCIHSEASGKHADEVFIFADASQWKLDNLSPGAMLATISLYEEAMNCPVTWSPASTALASLIACNDTPARRAWLAPMSEDLYYGIHWPENHAPSHVVKQINIRRFAHVFDKSGSHLAAAAGIDFGTGDPALVLGDQYSPKRAGLWQISARPGPDCNPDLPSPFSATNKRTVNHEWFYMPQVALALKMGWLVNIHQGYVWPERHRLMGEWAIKLYAARERARASGNAAAVALIKASYTKAFGLMKYVSPERKPPKRLQNPALDGMIVAEAYARQLGTILKLRELYSDCYFAVSHDALCLFSDERDPWLAFPYLAERRGRIGAYKYVATVEGPGDLLIAAARGAKGSEIMKMIGAQDA